MKYQFQIDNRPAGPKRSKWREAAKDAVGAGYASWSWRDPDAVVLNEQATIERIEEHSNGK